MPNEQGVSKSLECTICLYLIVLSVAGYKKGEKVSMSHGEKRPMFCIIIMSKEIINENTAVLSMDETATTTFVETGTRAAINLDTNTQKGDFRVIEQSMSDFLAKPILVNTSNWTSGQSINHDYMDLDIASVVLSNTLWANKISGYRLMRGTAVVRVELNANPFQLGFLRLWYLPDLTSRLKLMHTYDIEHKFMAPGITIDARNSSAEIRVPFVAPFDWYDIKNQDFSWGHVYLTVLESLAIGSGGTDSVYISTFMSIEDAEFSTPVVPQSEGKKKGKFSRKFSSSIDAEHKALNTGPISSALKVSSKAADTLSSIPALSAIMAPTSWALNLASGVAAAFGWSKAQIETPPMPMAPCVNRYMACSDGTDTFTPLGLISNHKTEVCDTMTIHDGDEMSFNFLKTQHGYINRSTWSATDLPDVDIFTLDVCPENMARRHVLTYNSKLASYATGPPAFYLSKAFSVWRGSVQVLIKFAKTDFHTGRLSIVWTPGTSSFTNPDLVTAAYSLREIVDLSNCSSICLNLPYLLADQYIPTNVYSGRLTIRVLNELRAPETVSQTVPMFVSIAGGEDFELQVTKASYDCLSFSPQMETGTVSDTKVVGAPRLCAGGPVSTERSSLCIGEHFTSIKQLLNRNTKIFCSATPSTTNYASANPWFSSTTTMNTTSGAIVAPTVGGDIGSYLFAMYAFFKGNARFAVQQPAVVYGPIGFSAAAAPIGFGTRYSIEAGNSVMSFANAAWASPGTYKLNACGQATVGGLAGVGGVEVPYASKALCSRVLMQTADTTMPVDKSSPLQYLALYQEGGLTTAGYTRSFSDDFQLMFYIGCPSVLETYV